LGWSGVGAQAAADKSSMKAQVDGLAADNSLLKTRVDGLAAEITQLKADQVKAQELRDKCQDEAKLKEESLRQRLQTAIDSLHS
jgi:cell division protein FtsB